MDDLAFIKKPLASSMSGMIDWMTLRIDASLLPESVRQILKENTARILKIDKGGRLEWESSVREVLKSDTHQIIIRFGSTLEIMGSPARVNSSHNVFGSLDIKQCFYEMLHFVQKHYQIIFPINIKQWSCTRIDINANYDLGSLSSVLQAIDSFKSIKVGRQFVSPYPTGCVWGQGSNLHSGKAYSKGVDLLRNVKKKRAFCTDQELQKSEQLLRLEYSCRRHMIQRIKEDSGLNWYDYTPSFLMALHDDYFGQFISTVEVNDVDSILNLLLNNVGDGPDQVPTESQARAAFQCYMNCKTVGKEKARIAYKAKTTWYRHLKNLKKSGITEVDLQPTNIVPLRKRQIVLSEPVSCWDDIKLAEGM